MQFQPKANLAMAGLLMSMAFLPAAHAQQVDPSVAAYRAALADKDGNPGLLVIDRGERLFMTAAGPKNANLATCDFGLGAGVLRGAYAQLPRWFEDTQRVQDLESRLLTCMVTLQGRDASQIKKQPFAHEGRNESNTEIEAITAYVAAQSDGYKMAMPLAHPKERESVSVGETLYWRQHGPMDFSCGTCHSEDGKRILYLDKGSKSKLRVGMQGSILQGKEGGTKLDGGSFTITKVLGDNQAVGSTDYGKSLGGNNRFLILKAK